MAGSEKLVEHKIKKYLDSIGAYYLKVHGSAYQPSGTPDILACVNGRFIAVEVKRPNGGVVSELQKSKIKKTHIVWDCFNVLIYLFFFFNCFF